VDILLGSHETLKPNFTAHVFPCKNVASN
jgi:hypothetical protein